METDAEVSISTLMSIWADLTADEWQDVLRTAVNKMDRVEVAKVDEIVTILYGLY